MVYHWLLSHFKKPVANVLILIWYVLLMLSVIYTINIQPGRFNYLKW